MTAYLIKYSTRRKGAESVPQGEWQDKKKVIVVSDDAREAINEVVDDINNSDFRLMGVKIVGQVDMIARKLK